MLIATAILVFALLIAITGALRTTEELHKSFAEQQILQRAQLTLEGMLKIQLDEENYIRAYVITHDRSYIDSYRATGAHLTSEESQLARALTRERLASAQTALSDYDAVNRDWHREVADRMLATNAAAPQLDEKGKAFIDTESQDAGFIEALLAAKSSEIARSSQAQIESTLSQRVGWLLVFGLAALLLNSFRSRAMRELEEERLITQTLQRAFRSEHATMPNCTIASAYGAASRHVAVGGDVFDVHRLSDRLALVLIADVSGKGVDAAVLTTFIKFTIRGIAVRNDDPAAMLQEFNTAFPRTVRDPYLFVTMLVGVLDTRTLRFVYASAGLDSGFVKRRSGVEQLQVTGPVLGVMDEPYSSQTVQLEAGDMLVLATDGLTEARDSHGAFLEAQGAARWIAQEGNDPGRLASGLIERIRTLEGNALHDDVAILAVRVDRHA